MGYILVLVYYYAICIIIYTRSTQGIYVMTYCYHYMYEYARYYTYQKENTRYQVFKIYLVLPGFKYCELPRTNYRYKIVESTRGVCVLDCSSYILVDIQHAQCPRRFILRERYLGTYVPGTSYIEAVVVVLQSSHKATTNHQARLGWTRLWLWKRPQTIINTITGILLLICLHSDNASYVLLSDMNESNPPILQQSLSSSTSVVSSTTLNQQISYFLFLKAPPHTSLKAPSNTSSLFKPSLLLVGIPCPRQWHQYSCVFPPPPSCLAVS